MLRAMDARRNSCSYSDDDFEKDEDDAGWTRISIKDIDMGREIGGGGVALVYEGYFRDEPVALKTLFDPKVDAALQKEYLDELLVMASLKHRNVVRFIGGCVDPPDLYYLGVPAVLRRLHAIDATRVHLTMTWVVLRAGKRSARKGLLA